MTDLFYQNLKPTKDFKDIADFSKYTPVPDDWYVVITDIKNSTEAIQNGKFKEINTVGAASIVSVLNISKKLEIPYVFGGDGSTLLIPPTLVKDVKLALAALREMAKNYFALDLRVGVVPLLDIEKKDTLSVLKVVISPHYSQAMLRGSAITLAEKAIKDPRTKDRYEVPHFLKGKADFQGFECRWNDIVSARGETVSLMIQAQVDHQEVYKVVLEKIEEIYGDEKDHHPVTKESLQLMIAPLKRFETEKYVRSGGQPGFRQFLYFIKILILNVYGRLAMRTAITVDDFNLSKYKKILMETSDFKKFDNCLRMVISGTPLMREGLTSFLEDLYAQKKIVYGIAVSNRALITCLVFERYGKQVHFIDGADGGLGKASVGLKQQLKDFV